MCRRSPNTTLAASTSFETAGPHAYQLDIPLMLAGDIHLQVFGPGVTAPDSGLEAAARLVWRNPDFAPVSLPPIRVEGAGSGFVPLVCRSVHVSAVAR